MPSVPWPRIEILGDDTYILRLLARVEYLESLPCDGQPLGWPARRPHTVRSEVKNHPRIGRRCASGGATLRRSADNSRSCQSQGSLSKYSTRDTKRNMYVSSPKKSIRGRRADGTVSGRLRTVCPRCDGLGSIFWETAHTYYAWYHEYSAWRASPAIVSLWVGRTVAFPFKRKRAPPDSDRLRLEASSHPGG